MNSDGRHELMCLNTPDVQTINCMYQLHTGPYTQLQFHKPPTLINAYTYPSPCHAQFLLN